MRALSVVAATASHVLRSSARARKASLAAPAVVVLLLAVGATPAAATLDDSGARGQTQATAQAPEFTLALDQGLVGNFAGYGAQLNQHVYAKISGPPPNLASLETKVITLEPQFVRIFFNTSEWTNPDRMDSFHRTVELARRAGAEVNITWQGSTFEFAMRNIARFADVLVDLLQMTGDPLWVTMFNEPNTTQRTLPEYEEVYRALDRELREREVRSRIHFMGGDLIRQDPRGRMRSHAPRARARLRALAPSAHRRTVGVPGVWTSLR